MADSRTENLNELTNLTIASTDVFPVDDVDADELKKITLANLTTKINENDGALAQLDTVGTSEIDDNAVTLDKIADVATNRIMGRSTAGTGSIEALTVAAAQTLLNVEDGATADQTGAEIKTLYEAEADTNAFTDAEQTKLAGIETGADVTDSTNVDAAGAVMNSDASTASMSFVVDEDNMSSDSATKVPTQQSVKAYVDALTVPIGIACSDETSDLTTGTAKATFRMPFAMTLTAVRASVTTAPVGSTITVDINEGGVSILSTKLTIDASEKTSTTAANAAVISDSALADDAEITIDIDQVGSSTAGAGLKVWLLGTKA